MFDRIAIIGLGLMGGSLGLAVKRRGLARTVAGYARRPETRDLAADLGIADELHASPDAAARGADLAVVCTSVGSIPVLLGACRDQLAAGGVATDVGSCKGEVVKRVEAEYPAGPVPYIGSHPIAGSERQGIEAASATLYERALVVLTPTRRTAPAARERVREFWQALGARVQELSPAAHDRLLARTSHLPHVVAALLAAGVGRARPAVVGRYCGAGFADTTRIADGDPRLWADILRANRAALRRELDSLAVDLDRWRRLLRRNDWDMIEQALRRGQDRRRALLGPPGARP